MKNSENIGLITILASPTTYGTLQKLVALGHRNIRVFCEGREVNQKVVRLLTERTGGDCRIPSLQDFEKLGFPFHFVNDINDEGSLAAIRAFHCKVIGNAGVSRIIKEPLLSIAPFGVINCHPGRLPDYRGRSPVEWALSQGGEVVATTHFMVEALDAGPIIKVAPLQIKGLSYHQIRARMLGHQAELLADSIHHVLKEGEAPSEYPTQGEGKVWKRFPAENLSTLLEKTF